MRVLQTRRVWLIVAGVLCVAVIVAAIQTLAMGHSQQKNVTQAATATVLPSPTAPRLPNGNDRAQYRFDLNGTGVNPEDLLTTANVSQLKQRWSTTASSAFQSTPAVVDGIIYVPNGHALYAYDLLTGAQLWHYTDVGGTGTISSSVAIDPTTHFAYYGTPDAHLYAVDTRTGQGAWNVRLGDSKNGAYIWGSPIAVNGKVYIGLASAEDHPCVRGAIFALDAATGKQVWVNYTDTAGKLGGGVWSTPAVDVSRGEIDMGTGNPCSTSANDQEQDSIIGLDWNTGKTKWKYTSMPTDTCDCDFTGVAMNFSYNGKDYIVEGNKFGGAYALIREGSGVKLAWMKRLARIEGTGSGGIYEPPAYRNGIVYFAAGFQVDGSCTAIYALKADTGAQVWKQCTGSRVIAPAAITGDLIFIAHRGVLQAFALKTGHMVWQGSMSGEVWGGVAISRGFVVAGGTKGTLFCFSVPAS